ncbi:polysaccharide deacetylase family protein [Thioalkalivibrio sp.]|uniref:polysaccharide deacetylase family protein n=1 Tax=Thioalkalivibrio sp. TaxID=2093813 RepID=UPI0035660192
MRTGNGTDTLYSLISIHDVMPATLPQVRGLLAQLRRHRHRWITLLVVPGRDWHPAEIDQLHAWQQGGLELAAHGWSHRAERLRGIRHRLHAALISRRAAEHLALDARGIGDRMRASAEWFGRQGLQTPSTYVPPAWALGRVPRDVLAELPFRRIEVMRGLLDPRTGRLAPLPLLGFEADTRVRSGFLALWNRLQLLQAWRNGLPPRISVHPNDPNLRLAASLDRCLASAPGSIRYADHQPEVPLQARLPES